MIPLGMSIDKIGWRSRQTIRKQIVGAKKTPTGSTSNYHLYTYRYQWQFIFSIHD
jgi:hypothetical protein